MPAYPDMPLTLPSGFQFNPNISTMLPAGTTANEVLAAMQQQYGVQKYSDQKSSRWNYYSGTAYPSAGQATINFFAQTLTQNAAGLYLADSDTQNGFGNYSMFVQSVAMDYSVLLPATTPQPQAYTTDATAIYSDLLHGFAQCGVWSLTVGTNLFDYCPKPFLYSPPGAGELKMDFGSEFALTQAGGSPFAVTDATTNLAYADLNRRANRRRILKNPLFLAPQQTFVAQLAYPSGLIPIIATTVITGTASLNVFAVLGGTRFAPLG